MLRRASSSRRRRRRQPRRRRHRSGGARARRPLDRRRARRGRRRRRRATASGVRLSLHVAPRDMGASSASAGGVAQALRSVVRAAAARDGTDATRRHRRLSDRLAPRADGAARGRPGRPAARARAARSSSTSSPTASSASTPGSSCRRRRAAAGRRVARGRRRSRPHQGRHLVIFVGRRRARGRRGAREASLLAPSRSTTRRRLFVHELIGAERRRPAAASPRHGHRRRGQPGERPAGRSTTAHLVPLRFVVELDDGAIIVEVPDGLFE